MPGATDTSVPMLDVAHKDRTAMICIRKSAREDAAGLSETKSNSTSSKKPGWMRPGAQVTGRCTSVCPRAGTVTGMAEVENGVRSVGGQENMPVASTPIVDLKMKAQSMVVPGKNPSSNPGLGSMSMWILPVRSTVAVMANCSIGG